MKNSNAQQIKALYSTLKNARQFMSDEFVSSLRVIGLNFSEDFKAVVYSDQVELLVEKKDGKRVFGSDINMYYREDFFNKEESTKLELNTGSMGSFDLSCVASVSKAIMMGELVKNFKEVEKLVEKYTNAVDLLTKATQTQVGLLKEAKL